MSYNSLNYDSVVQNVGQKYNPYENLGRIQKVILTPVDFSFQDESAALTRSNWQDAIEQIADRVFPLPDFWQVEDNSEDSAYDERPGGKILVEEGQHVIRGMCKLSMYDTKKLRSFNNKSWRAWLVDVNGNIIGTNLTGTLAQGLRVRNLTVEKMMLPNSEVTNWVPVNIHFDDAAEIMDNGIILQPKNKDADAWDPTDLDGLTDVELTVESQTTSQVTVKAQAEKKGVNLTGFDETGDWVIKDDSESSVSVTSVTDNGDGTYVLEASLSAGTYTVDLADPKDLSQDGYESTGSVEFTTS
jgi:hypothetical protein